MKNTTTLFTIAVILSACAGQADLPTVTTDEVTGITYNSATVNATVTDDGGAPVEARGVCYSTSPQPSLDNGTCTSNDRGTGTFSAEINNLSTNTTYYTRAYATNSEGTGYANELTFDVGGPQINTGQATNISFNSFQCSVAVDGISSAIADKGICYYQSTESVTAAEYISYGAGSGSFNHTFTGIISGTTYNVLGYAIYEQDTLYGNQVSVTTPSFSGSGNGVTDIDGNFYETSIIGDQEWMAENLNTATYRDGTPIYELQDANYWTDPACGILNAQYLGDVTNEYCADPEPQWNQGVMSFGAGLLTNGGTYGAVWMEKLNWNEPFQLPLSFSNDDESVEGFAIVFQGVSNTIAPTGRFGCEGIESSVAIVFDQYADTSENDPPYANLSIMANGEVNHNSINNLAGPVPGGINDPSTSFQFKLNWNPVTSELSLSEAYSATPLIAYQGDVVNNFFNGVNETYFGFTASRRVGVVPTPNGSTRIGLYLYPPSEGASQNQWLMGIDFGRWCYYSNSVSFGQENGKLYNWNAVANERGLCPTGWHVPSLDEFTEMVDYLGGAPVAGGKMKNTDLDWEVPNTGATNESGFNARPSGFRNSHAGTAFPSSPEATFDNSGITGTWWTSSMRNDGTLLRSYDVSVSSTSAAVEIGNVPGQHQYSGLSVRCVKD